MPFSRKRVAFTKILNGTGIIRLIEAFPTRAGLLVLTYHRLGNKPDCDFDRGVISASADQFDQQIAFLKRRFPIVDFEEALRLLRNPTGMKHYYVLLSFDDGYLDNYEAALPVLRAHGCSAIFFVVPQLVGTATLPWWDEIAFLVRSCRRSTLEISRPVPYELELGPDREPAIEVLLRLFKSTANREPDIFLEQLREQANIPIPIQPRRFMNWVEICELAESGMEIGSHTASHLVLGRLPPGRQLQELVSSKMEIEAHTRMRVRAVAYPVGSRTAFSETTEQLVIHAGYEAAFSSYGGMNSPPECRLTSIRRMVPWRLGDSMFATEMSLMSHFGPELSRLAENRSLYRNW